MEAESRFRAMGSDVHVVLVGGSLQLLEEAREMIERLEGMWSRFRPDSEISRLNDLTGVPVPVSAETVALVQRAVDGARISEGRFDPTVLGAVIRSGYDRSFELLNDEGFDPDSSLTSASSRSRSTTSSRRSVCHLASDSILGRSERAMPQTSWWHIRSSEERPGPA
jgi:hypothetical protein